MRQVPSDLISLGTEWPTSLFYTWLIDSGDIQSYFIS